MRKREAEHFVLKNLTKEKKKKKENFEKVRQRIYTEDEKMKCKHTHKMFDR